MWPDRRFLDLAGIEHPVIQAPMAGSSTPTLAAEVSAVGGLGSLACAMASVEQTRAAIAVIRQRTDKPFNVNFFCHEPPVVDAGREAAWRRSLAPFYAELGVDASKLADGPARVPFDAAMCDLMVETRPKIVSFHFGLPAEPLLRRVRDAGCLILSSATTVAEARWLEDHGVDAIVAQGSEAGGHRGMFLTTDIAAQVGTMALVPQVVDAVKVPVIATGGIADARGIVAALALGAAAVQLGTAYLLCPEAATTAVHRAALKAGRDDTTALTNLFTGRPARGHFNRLMRARGPIGEAPQFPLAANAVAPLRAAGEATGSGDFSPLWSGQAARLAREIDAATLTKQLIDSTRAGMARLRV